jgi:transcriptional regulator with XRE-family HTH domain
MGKKSRERPRKLGAKLLRIRNDLGLSQTEMWRRLGLEDQASYTVISGYETGRLEPSLITLLKYARLAKVNVEILIDDGLKLPAIRCKRLA